MERNNTRKTCGIIVMAAIFALAMCTATAFADEQTDGSNVSVQVTVGEHGSVNGHTDDYTETASSGADLVLSCQADEGFVVGAILVNETELEAEDVEGIAGKASGSLTLEGLEEDLTVAVNFAEGTDDNGSDGDDPEAGTTDPGDTGGDAGGDEGTDPGSAGGSTEDDPAAGITDPGDAGGDEGIEPTSADPTAAEPSDPEQAEPAGGEEEISEPQPTADDDSAKDPAAGETKDDSADAGKDGKGSDTATDSGMPDSSVYKTDSTPKTGDSFPTTVILLLMTSLSGMGGLGVRHLLKIQGGMSA